MSSNNFLENLLGRPGIVPNSGMNPTQWVEALNILLNLLENGIRNNYGNTFPSEVEINQGLEKLRHLRLFAENNKPSLNIAFADIIDNIKPKTSCSDKTFSIRGHNFGKPLPLKAHPIDKVLLLPSNTTPWDPIPRSRIAEVPIGHWKDNSINLPLPNWIGVGCVGFLDLNILQQWERYVEGLYQLFHDLFVWIRSYLGSSSDSHVSSPKSQKYRFELNPPTDTPPSTGHNYLIAGVPAIRSFLVNDQYNCTVEPGSIVTISWDLFNANDVKVEKKINTPSGISWLPIYQGNLLSGSCQYAPPGNGAFNHELKLTATNSCGSSTAENYIHIRLQPNVTIKGIEVIQSIQEFSFEDQTRQNIVPLFQGKRTMVRVYVDPGLPLNFNSGILSYVTGRISGGYLLGDKAIPPFDASNVRLNLGASLNFILYDNALTGSEMTFDVEVFSNDPYLNWGRIRKSCTVKLEIPKTIDVYYFLVSDAFGNQTTYDEVGASFDRLRSIYPIAWSNGINIKGCYLMSTLLDFNDDLSWEGGWDWQPPFSLTYYFTGALFDLLEEAADELEDNGEVFCAIVPQAACTNSRGVGWPGGLDWASGSNHRMAYWRATSRNEQGNYIEAHEVGHALNLDDNGGSINIIGVDLRDPHSLNIFRPPSYDQTMKKTSDFRWINPGEYLFLHYRDSEAAFFKCVELGLSCDISTFYIEI